MVIYCAAGVPAFTSKTGHNVTGFFTSKFTSKILSPETQKVTGNFWTNFTSRFGNGKNRNFTGNFRSY